MLMKLTLGVNFTNVFHVHFFYMKKLLVMLMKLKLVVTETKEKLRNALSFEKKAACVKSW